MEQVLFVNACVRGEKSRTLKLARHFLEVYQAGHPDHVITECNLCQERLQPQYPEILAERDALWSAGKLDHPMFEPARRFAAAEHIIIAAPFWDLNYPALLKIYLERISVANLTFGYNDKGEMIGLCQAKDMIFITTRGGAYQEAGLSWMEMGARHLEALCSMYGIGCFQCLAVEGLDDVRRDQKAMMQAGLTQAELLAKEL